MSRHAAGIDRDGKLVIERGFVRPEDEPPVAASSPEGCRGDDMGSDASQPAAQHTVISIGADAEADDGEDDAIRPLPDRLVTELTAYRTLALRDALANDPHVAFTTISTRFVATSSRKASHQAACRYRSGMSPSLSTRQT